MLTSKITKVIDHPDETGVTFTLRRLSYRQLREAEDAKRDAALKLFAQLGDGASNLPSGTSEEQTRIAQLSENRYDLDVVLKYGITAWSYPEPCDDEHKGELDESTAKWLFAAILGHSVRSADEGEGSASASQLTTA